MGFNPFKSIKKIVKKIGKGIAKIGQKLPIFYFLTPFRSSLMWVQSSSICRIRALVSEKVISDLTKKFSSTSISRP